MIAAMITKILARYTSTQEARRFSTGQLIVRRLLLERLLALELLLALLLLADLAGD